jgi:hypothetical protein
MLRVRDIVLKLKTATISTYVDGPSLPAVSDGITDAHHPERDAVGNSFASMEVAKAACYREEPKQGGKVT